MIFIIYITVIFIAYIKDEVLIGGFAVLKNTFKIERHYGNKDLKTIIGNLISLKFSNLKFKSETYDKSYYDLDTDKISQHQGESKQ